MAHVSSGARAARFSLPLVVDPVITNRQLFQGWPVECYKGIPFPVFHQDLPWSPYDLDFQIRAANVLALQYSDPQAAFDYLSAWLGPTFDVQRRDNSASLIPGSLEAWSPGAVIQFVSGTTTDDQLSTQAFASLVGPFDFGPYSSLALWEDARRIMADRLTTAGLVPSQPLMLVGHSYGGAVSILQSYLVSTFNAARAVGCLTFGAPPTGDVGRRRPLPRNLKMCNIANEGDICPSLPPANEELLWLLSFEPLAPIFPWSQWRRPQPVWSLTSTGGFFQLDGETANLLDLGNAAVEAVAGLPIDPAFTHRMPEYQRRLLLVR